jgi:hypothetical protein
MGDRELQQAELDQPGTRLLTAPMRSRRLLDWMVGFVNRIVYAALFAMLGWYSCVFPPGFAWQSTVQKALCYSLTYPLALVGRVTQPYRGLDVFFDHGGEWCDFCSAQQVLWYHLLFAVPVYVALFYLPTLVLALMRMRRSRLLREESDGAAAEPPKHA